MDRAKPGTKGGGEYFRIEVRPKSQFEDFRYHDVGDPGHIQRLAGKRANGNWATQAWLISKDDAHLEGDHLIPDTKDAREVMAELESIPVRKKGDVFMAKDRKNVPEREKPTPAQQRARQQSIGQAQASRWYGTAGGRVEKKRKR